MNEQMELLLTQIKNISFNDIATLPQSHQPEFIDHLEALQDILSDGVFSSDSNESTPPP